MIRQEQMDVFEAALRDRFKEKLFLHLRNELTGRGRSVEANWLNVQITRGLAEASDYGLSSERHVMQFVETTCLELGGFPEGSLPRPALAILYTYGIDPHIKMERYREWAQSPRDE